MMFANPHMLWLLLVIPPALLAFFWWSWRKRTELMRRFIHSRLLPVLTVGLSPARQKLSMAALVCAAVFLILALARPQWGFTWEEARSRGLDIVVAVDVSKSMLAEDIPPNRLARARLAVLDLLAVARTDRLGLVAFAGTAFLQCPLTIDDAAFRQSLGALNVGIIPEGGTAIAEAIQTALTAFKEDDNHKVLVLFTDGEDHDSGALEAAGKAARAGLKIFAIGLGTPEGELLRVRDAKGRTDYIRDEGGNVVKSRLNEDLLRQIAGATEGGFYLPLRGAKTIDTLYEQGLAPLPKSEREERLLKKYHERYHWPLGVALALLLFEYLFPTRKREGSAVRREQSRGVAIALLLVSLLLQPLSAEASASSALRKYRQGDYEGALQEYEELLKRKSEDPRLHFNAGAAAYRKEAYDEAVRLFSDALNSPDLNLQQSAYYNRGNTFFELGKNSPEAAKTSEYWKKSIQDFESALKLNAQDAEAQHNREVVKKLLEQLQQQQQQQQNSGDKQEEQDQQESQDQQQSQSGGEDDQDQQQQQQQGEEEQQQQQQSSEEQEGEQPQPEPSEQGEQEQQQSGSAQEGEDERQENPGERQAEAGQPGKMTPEQARQLLDAQKGEERVLPMPPNQKRTTPRRGPLRDW